MNNFYPGPSKLYPQVRSWLSEIYDSGILAKNHRSDAFMQLWLNTEEKLRTSLSIPADREIYVTSSATECWEIVNQSLLTGKTNYVYNGAFGEKWFEYGRKNTSSLVKKSLIISGSPFDIVGLPTNVLEKETDTICLTHNETSNGTYLPAETLEQIRKSNPEALIAIDATSSMGGVALPWETADVWFASVQKCFGLPSGMAVMVVSPKAIERAEELNERSHYNSLLNIRSNFLKNQTPYTPNILGIALLEKQAGFVENIAFIDKKIRNRAKHLYEFITHETPFDLLVNNESTRSPTVLTVRGDESAIKRIMFICDENGITLGKGYGEWKETTFRVANFPAIEDEEFEELRRVISSIY